MVKAIMVDQFGGPDVMQWRDIGLPEPGAGMARVRHEAIGLNFIDTYHRSGLYPLDLPTGLGTEAAGVSGRQVRPSSLMRQPSARPAASFPSASSVRTVS